jgi:IclR family acetate operon transcriptional repressor
MSGMQTVDRVIAILNCFDEEREELGVSEIAALTGLSKGTAHRLLLSLVSHGLADHVSIGGRYRLGPHVVRLAYLARGHVNLEKCALPVMYELRDGFEETVGLHVLDGDMHRRVIAQVESLHQLRRTYTEINQPIPIHLGAPGKVMLAYQPASRRDQLLSQPLLAATPGTVVDPTALRQQLDLIRERGFAISQQERVEGISSLSVPVTDHTGTVRAAISISGPSTRVTEDRLLSFAPTAVNSAATLSTSLGAPAPVPSRDRPTGALTLTDQ